MPCDQANLELAALVYEPLTLYSGVGSVDLPASLSQGCLPQGADGTTLDKLVRRASLHALEQTRVDPLKGIKSWSAGVSKYPHAGALSHLQPPSHGSLRPLTMPRHNSSRPCSKCPGSSSMLPDLSAW